MKYFAVFILAIVCVAALSFFTYDPPYEEPRLKMSTFVFDDSIADPNDWDKKSNVFTFEELELGVPKIVTTSMYDHSDLVNINILFEYDGGIIQATSDDVQISVGDGAGPFYLAKRSQPTQRFGYNFHVNDSGYMAFNPVIGGSGACELDEKHFPLDPSRRNALPGNETFINVRVYKNDLNEWPLVTATIKLTQLYDGRWPVGKPVTSDFFQIELISYE